MYRKATIIASPDPIQQNKIKAAIIARSKGALHDSIADRPVHARWSSSAVRLTVLTRRQLQDNNLVSHVSQNNQYLDDI